MRQRKPVDVAELGRPETPEEMAERRAENSRKHRSGQTLFNLTIALVASLGIVLFLILVAVRPDLGTRDSVDYRTTAQQAQSGISAPLAAPILSDEWTANAATLNSHPADGVVTWYVGFVTPRQQFIGMRQGIDANPTWVANQLAGSSVTDTVTIERIEWAVYDRRDAKDPGNMAYAMTTTAGGSSYVLFGTAPLDEFSVLATALSQEIEETQ